MPYTKATKKSEKLNLKNFVRRPVNAQDCLVYVYTKKQGQILYHIYADGRLVATFDTTGTKAFQYHQLKNLTSNLIQTDPNETPIRHYEYLAFTNQNFARADGITIAAIRSVEVTSRKIWTKGKSSGETKLAVRGCLRFRSNVTILDIHTRAAWKF